MGQIVPNSALISRLDRMQIFVKNCDGWRRQAIAFMAGGLMAFALPPFFFFPICFFSFAVFVFLLDGIYEHYGLSRHRAFFLASLTGWFFGFGYFTGGLWWLGRAMFVDLSSYGWLLPFAIFGLPAVLACFYSVATWIAFLLWQKFYGRILALSFAFGVVEWLRSWIFTGFPWNSLGYTAMPVPLLMQPVAFIGLYSMNSLAVLIYATTALIFEKQQRLMGLSIAFFLIVMDLCLGFYRLTSVPLSATTLADTSIHVRLVQISSLPDNDPTSHNFHQDFHHYLQLTSAPALKESKLPDIIIWPETAIPADLERNPWIRKQIASILKDGQILLTGSLRFERNHKNDFDFSYFNSFQALNSQGNIIGFTDKVHLVPFGEYLPFPSLFTTIGLFNLVNAFNPFYQAASTRHSIELPNGLRILPLICYEAIFPEEINRYQGKRPNLLINITNDSWFGTTPGPWQHFEQARIRAIEQAIPLIRVANNGISAVIDPYGRLLAEMNHNETGFRDLHLSSEIFSSETFFGSSPELWNKIPILYSFIVISLFLLISSLVLKLSYFRLIN